MTLKISNLEVTLIKAISSSTAKTGVGSYVWLHSLEKSFSGSKALQKAADAALSSGLIEFDPTDSDPIKKGVKLTKFAQRLMLALK